jgi:hypothetical protein
MAQVVACLPSKHQAQHHHQQQKELTGEVSSGFSVYTRREEEEASFKILPRVDLGMLHLLVPESSAITGVIVSIQ